VGYSLPAYDIAVSDLLRKGSRGGLIIDVFDPEAGVVAERLASVAPQAHIKTHCGLPYGIADLAELPLLPLDSAC
jgi:hypothetical protein